MPFFPHESVKTGSLITFTDITQFVWFNRWKMDEKTYVKSVNTSPYEKL